VDRHVQLFFFATGTSHLHDAFLLLVLSVSVLAAGSRRRVCRVAAACEAVRKPFAPVLNLI
jgi:hypothetical protein